MAATVTKGVALFKKVLHEVPELVFAHAVGLVGVCIGIRAAINYAERDGDNREYKVRYVVMRPDDKRAKYIHPVPEADK